MPGFCHLKTIICSLTLLIVLGPSAWAGSVAIALDGFDAPAVDLVSDKGPLDRDQAIDLKASGVDLSLFDPLPTDAWQGESLPAVETGNPKFPDENTTVRFVQDLPSSSGLYRGRVVVAGDGGQSASEAFQLMVSLSQHTSMARSALLRKLGYPVTTPRHYRRLTLSFSDLAARERFLDAISDSTLTARKRWVADLPDNFPQVTLQDVVLEPAQIDIPMYHWGVVPASHLKGRRALRALIVPLALLEIHESVNLYSWELGKIINRTVILQHPYAESFQETTFDDARWLARKIAKLTRNDLTEIVRIARYPADITALLIEKLVARRNHLVQIFGLDRVASMLPYDSRITVGHVREGKLIRSDYDGYALRFSYGDPESPIRPAEVARFILIEGISSGISALMNEANRFLTVKSVSDVAMKHQQEIIRDMMDHFKKNPGAPYARPVGAWGGPVGGMSLNASRNVVTGTYFGSDAKVQLVDNIGVQANLGYFVGVDGMAPAAPAALGNVVLQRNYLHIRPIADLDTALRTDWSELYVPKFMGGLASILDKGALGEISDDQAQIDERLREFLDALKEGEMLVIADSVMAGVRGMVNVPIPIFMTPPWIQFNPSMTFSVGSTPTVLRRTTFIRTANGVQIYLQGASLLQAETGFDLNWWINVARAPHLRKKGSGLTKAFLLDQEENAPQSRKQLLLALRALFRANHSELLEQNFKEYRLRHQTNADIKALQVLAWRWATIEEGHRVSVAPPGYPDQVRTLFSDRLLQSEGTDGYSIFSEIVNSLTRGALILNKGSSGYYPSNSFLGTGAWRKVTTEAEITPGLDSHPVTAIEHHIGGWILSRDGLLKALEAIEAKVRPLNLDRPVLRKDVFQSTRDLQMYEILSTLIVYPEGVKRISAAVFEPDNVDDAVKALVDLEGPEQMQSWCSPWWRRIGNFMSRGDVYAEIQNGKRKEFNCLKPWMKKLLEFRAKHRNEVRIGKVKTAEEKVRWTNRLMAVAEKQMELSKLLSWIGKENYLFQIRVSGFRTRDENGDSEYVSDTIGTFDNEKGAGIFREFAQKYGVLSSEIYATYLSEGF